MKELKKVAVISSGNGGQAMAAYVKHLGFDVSLYVREQDRVDMFDDCEFELEGVVRDTVCIDLISCDMAEVIKDAELIMVTTPAQYHSHIAKEMAPHIMDGQVIVLNPGRTFGTYVIQGVFDDMNVSKDIVLAETDTFVFTCRNKALANPKIYSIKDVVSVGSDTKEHTEVAHHYLDQLFPGVFNQTNVLTTSFNNFGMILHPLPTLMNITRVENGEEMKHFHEGVTPMVADMIMRLDQERMIVANYLGIHTTSVSTWLNERYGSVGENLYELLHNTSAYNNVYLPNNLRTRYIFEDIPTGLVPLLAISRKINVKLPMTEAIVEWASAVYNIDFYNNGRNERNIDLDKIIEDSPFSP